MSFVNTIRDIKVTVLSGLCVIALLGIPLAAESAPGTLSNSPLFLTNAVEPNLFFLSDDSGSMDWGLMTDESDGLMNLLFLPYYYVIPTADDNNSWVVPTEEALLGLGESAPFGGVWRAWNSAYNRLYYDPGITYEPWEGVDNAGVAYANSTPTAARLDPYNAATGTMDLTATTIYFTDYGINTSLGVFAVVGFYPPRYYTWTDSDADGNVDPGDGHALVEIKAGSTYDGGADRSDCTADAAAPLKCTYTEEIQNFANWFTYYRRREFATKNAISRVIADLTNVRAGYGTINNNGGVKIANASLNPNPTTGNKKSLLDKVFSTQSSSGTPLRRNLDKVGKYYKCENDDFFGGSASCPILSAADGGTCQQNFAMLLTDGFYNGGNPSPAINNPDGNDNTAFDGDPYGDTYSETLADVAMEYYENDLSTLADEVPTIPGVDEADHQHMVTYTVAFGVDGTLDPFDTVTPGDATDTDPADPAFNWPNPTSGDFQKIDDLWHAAYNGRGEYLNAQNPKELADSISDAFDSILDRTSSAAAVAFNTTSLSANSAVYFSRFTSNQWSGELFSYPLDPTTGAVLVNDPSVWEASNVLDSRDLTTDPRVILTRGAADGVAFQWANLTTDQKNDLKTNPGGGVDADPIAQARLDYLRGDRSDEGAGQGFRLRSSRLGDIIHANPLFVGAPELNWPDIAPFPTASGETYSDFKTGSASSRAEIIYTGVNDGMLHGFRASDGQEVLAYIPANLFSTGSNEGLHALTDPGYSHRYYVDLSPAVSDVYSKTCVVACGAASTTVDAWRTVLVGGERSGGRGLFALDVTDPSLFAEANAADLVMWEFTDSDDADLGYLTSEPIIALMNNGEWAAIFGNGYNSTSTGEARLFIVFLEGGLDGAWTLGTDYLKISTEVGTLAAANGLSGVSVQDTDSDGDADRVYAGDLQGNMWVFDLSDSNSSNWEVAYKQGTTPKPLFTAINGSGDVQPITSRPVVVSNTETTESGNEPNRLVLFGTGQYLVSGDINTADVQSFYGVWDRGSQELLRADLLEQTIVSGTFTDGDGNTVSDIRVTSDNAINYGPGNNDDKGWFMDLPISGERVVVNPAVRGDLVFFNTLVPESAPCSSGGYGFLMSVKQSNGGRPDTAAFDLNNSGVVDDQDLVNEANLGLSGIGVSGQKLDAMPASSSFLSNRQYTPDSDGNINQRAIEELDTPKTGRFSWIELGRD